MRADRHSVLEYVFPRALRTQSVLYIGIRICTCHDPHVCCSAVYETHLTATTRTSPLEKTNKSQCRATARLTPGGLLAYRWGPAMAEELSAVRLLNRSQALPFSQQEEESKRAERQYRGYAGE